MATGLAPGFGYSGQAKHRMSFEEVKRLAEAFGLPGTAIAQIAKGESSLYADIQQHDPGDGMVGYGLLQMTPNAWGKGSAAYKYMQKLGGVRAMKDPVKNMQMARFLYKSAGNKLTPWYGTRFLTNRSGEGTLKPIDRSKLPSLSGSTQGGGGSSGVSRGSTRTITETTPGVDNSMARYQLVQDFLGTKSSDPLQFALQARELKDIPATTTSRTVRTGSSRGGGGAPRPSSGGGGGGVPGLKGKGSGVFELFYDPQGGWKYGKPIGAIGGHSDHVHVAAGPKTIVALGKLAQEMGLHVGENPHFGGVAPVHTTNSFHYKPGGEAIDVSGDTAKMAAYARRVRRLYGLK